MKKILVFLTMFLGTFMLTASYADFQVQGQLCLKNDVTGKSVCVNDVSYKPEDYFKAVKKLQEAKEDLFEDVNYPRMKNWAQLVDLTVFNDDEKKDFLKYLDARAAYLRIIALILNDAVHPFNGFFKNENGISKTVITEVEIPKLALFSYLSGINLGALHPVFEYFMTADQLAKFNTTLNFFSTMPRPEYNSFLKYQV